MPQDLPRWLDRISGGGSGPTMARPLFLGSSGRPVRAITALGQGITPTAVVLRFSSAPAGRMRPPGITGGIAPFVQPGAG